MSRLLGIIGYPIGHSLSPVFHQAALDHYGLDITYQAWEVAPHELRGFVEPGLRACPDLLGFNVTVPHKEAIISYLDEVSPEARSAGAVNTVVNHSGRLSGHNTDGLGFLRALNKEAGFSPGGRRVLILGAGGAARGVATALVSHGVGPLTIANRTLERAHRLAQDLAKPSMTIGAIPLRGGGLRRAAQEADLIVQCTTMGMFHGPNQAGIPLKAQDIPPTALVYDLVYNPPETPLMKEARRAGARALGGLSMLVYQGAIAFEMWTGRGAPVEVMFRAARESLEARTR